MTFQEIYAIIITVMVATILGIFVQAILIFGLFKRIPSLLIFWMIIEIFSVFSFFIAMITIAILKNALGKANRGHTGSYPYQILKHYISWVTLSQVNKT